MSPARNEVPRSRMKISARFLEPGDGRWQACLQATRHDFYHRPDYATNAARHAGGRPCAFWASTQGHFLLVPLLMRSLPEHLGAPQGWQDAVSPYGYASPLFSQGAGPATQQQLWQIFRRHCREHAVLTVFLRCHPMLPAAIPGPGCGTLVKEGETVFIDLTLPEAEHRRQTRENHRRDIRKLAREGFRVQFNHWVHFDAFISQYHATMVRNGADPAYLFDRDYFRDLVKMAPGAIQFCAVTDPDEKLAAGGLFFCWQDIIQFHLSGTAARYLQKSPGKMMFEAVRTWGKAAGYKVLHLGGGVGCRPDSLFRFKAGFSPLRAEFHTIRMVSDMPAYAAMVQPREQPGPGVDISRGFFPSYRRPLASGQETLEARVAW